MGNFQIAGAISNSHVGHAFEYCTQTILAAQGLILQLNHKVPCGFGSLMKDHASATSQKRDLWTNG